MCGVGCFGWLGGKNMFRNEDHRDLAVPDVAVSGLLQAVGVYFGLSFVPVFGQAAGEMAGRRNRCLCGLGERVLCGITGEECCEK